MLTYAIALIGTVIGTATDIDHHEVPDWLNYSLIASGILISIIVSIRTTSIFPFISSLIAGGVCFVLGAIMYYLGQWGGGDTKLITGIGALFGVSFSGWISDPPAIVLFLLFSIICGAIYGIIWSLVLMIIHFKEFSKGYKKHIQQTPIKILRYVSWAIAASAVLILIFMSSPLNWMFFVLLAVVFFALHMSIAVTVVEQTCFYKQKVVSELVEGDWLAEEVKLKNKIIESKPTGLDKEDLLLLQKSTIETVRIKEGIPFVPSFLFALIITYWWKAAGLGLLFWL